ncbi:MAG: MarR family winged helix-turn-helix transcriptional regulator [Bacillota bacterium]
MEADEPSDSSSVTNAQLLAQCNDCRIQYHVGGSMSGDANPVRFRGLLAELTRALRLLERSEAGCCGVTLSQCHLMLEVNRKKEKGCSLSDLASALGIDMSTVSRVADGLVRRGLLRRLEDPKDRRRVCFQLTEAGHELVTRINLEMDAFASCVLQNIVEGKRELVIECLALLVEATWKANRGCCV